MLGGSEPPALPSLQVAEMRRTLTPANSPVSSPSKHGDRFIPSRAGANWSVNFHRINVRGCPGGGGAGGPRQAWGARWLTPAGPASFPSLSPRRMRSPPAKTGKPRMPPQTMAKVRSQPPPKQASPRPRLPLPCPFPALWSPLPTDGLAYSALLKNELLGAGIEKVQDPQTEDRRLQPSTPEKKGLFTVSPLPLPAGALYLARPPGSAFHVPLPRSPWEPLNPTPRAKALLSRHEGRSGAGATFRVLSLGAAPAQGWEEPGLGLLRDGQGAGGRRGSGEADTGKSLSRRRLILLLRIPGAQATAPLTQASPGSVRSPRFCPGSSSAGAPGLWA